MLVLFCRNTRMRRKMFSTGSLIFTPTSKKCLHAFPDKRSWRNICQIDNLLVVLSEFLQWTYNPNDGTFERFDSIRVLSLLAGVCRRQKVQQLEVRRNKEEGLEEFTFYLTLLRHTLWKWCEKQFYVLLIVRASRNIRIRTERRNAS